MLEFGYNSNGFADHSWSQMLQVLSRFGYRGIGITLDHHHLDPFHVTRDRLSEMKRELAERQLAPVVETGARFYLDAFRKHRPSLVSVDPAGRKLRVKYYLRAVEIAAELEAKCVSLWSGVPQPNVPRESTWQRLEEGLAPVLERAEELGIVLAFEPEPGMFIETLADFAELRRRLPHPALRLTIDLGHLAVSETDPLDQHVHEWSDDLVNVHIEDIRSKRHEHLPLGEGEIDFPPLLKALERIHYSGVVQVELSRHSAEAPIQAQRSLIFLRQASGA